MTAYAASGTYTSPVYNAGSSVAWQNASWVSDIAPGTSVSVQVRTGTTPTPDATWTAFTTVALGGAINRTGQYAQYKVALSTTVGNTAPAVKEVVLTFVR
jgi:hypothetical protein